jgi:hypothetical protein
MQRRDFLAAIAASAAAGGLTPDPVAALEPGVVETATEDMDAYCARVDAGLKRIASWEPTAGTALVPAEREQLDTLARNAFQTMFLTGMLGDLPLDRQLHHGIQDRLDRAMPLFDEANGGMQAFLASRTDDDLARVQSALKEAGMRAALRDAIVSEARLSGVSPSRQRQLHGMLDDVTWRLAHQPPQLLIGEYLDKVRKAEDTDVEAESRQRKLIERLGEDAFWQAAEKSTRDKRIARGAKVMGIGLVVFGLSAAIVAAGAFPAVFAATVGVIMMLVGLIILIVGLLTPGPAPKPTGPS